ncbi:MAG TPA: hypothetical protein VF026_15075 [Ktedonobacteraceae bacterium]
MYDVDATIISVEVRTIGKRVPIYAPWHVAIPPALLQEKPKSEHVFRLRNFIEHLVREEVRAFRQCREDHHLLRVLSPDEIADAASKGKIAMGGPNELRTKQDHEGVDEEDAVQIALQGFVDGLYFVFFDGQQQRDLDAPMQPHPTSTVTFIRLVPLVGG